MGQVHGIKKLLLWMVIVVFNTQMAAVLVSAITVSFLCLLVDGIGGGYNILNNIDAHVNDNSFPIVKRFVVKHHL